MLAGEVTKFNYYQRQTKLTKVVSFWLGSQAKTAPREGTVSDLLLAFPYPLLLEITPQLLVVNLMVVLDLGALYKSPKRTR